MKLLFLLAIDFKVLKDTNSFALLVLYQFFYKAEFGDHDPERHTLQYLKEFVLVPKVSHLSSITKIVLLPNYYFVV